MTEETQEVFEPQSLPDENPPVDVEQQTPAQAPAPNKPSRPGWMAFLFEVLQTLLLAVVLYFMIDAVLARVRVENISMTPTLIPGEFVLVNKLAYRFDEMRYGDIIVFHYPVNPKEDYVKRVIGLPGDEIRIQNGVLTVNGKTLQEDYLPDTPIYTGDKTWIVPEASVFVMGDNRNSSSDSRLWGFVPANYIVGKALVIYWPFDQFRILTHPTIVNASATR